jgi:hypothetical protein
MILILVNKKIEKVISYMLIYYTIMQDIIKEYITKNYNLIVNESILKNINVESCDSFDNYYLYNISIKTENYKGEIYNFNDKLEITIYSDYILYKNLYRGTSNVPIINITSLPNLGNIIKNNIALL